MPQNNSALTNGVTETRAYNTFGQLIRVTAPGVSTTYAYRADGLRHAKTSGGAVVTHVWNGANALATGCRPY